MGGQVGQFRNLEHLHLNDTKVTDEGMALISDLRGLESMQFRGTQVTDAGLKQLYGMTLLKRVLIGNKISGNGWAALLSQLPACKIK
jgi:hypothetical protein